MTDEKDMTTCDGKPMCVSAARITKPRNYPDQKKGSTLNFDALDHTKLQHICDKLWKAPKYIERIHSVLFSSEFPMPKTIDESENVFENGQAKCIARLSVSFLIERIQGVYGVTEPMKWKGILEAVAKQGKESLVVLTVHDLQYGANESVPKELWNDEVKLQYNAFSFELINR